MSTLLGLRLALFLFIKKPALLKSLSLGVEVAGILRIDFATLDIIGSWTSFCFHHSSWLKIESGVVVTGSVRYNFNSFLALIIEEVGGSTFVTMMSEKKSSNKFGSSFGFFEGN